MRWTIAQVAGALGTRPGTGLNPLARVAGVSIDSRTIRAGELFIAIHGQCAQLLQVALTPAVGASISILPGASCCIR